VFNLSPQIAALVKPTLGSVSVLSPDLEGHLEFLEHKERKRKGARGFGSLRENEERRKRVFVLG
jgi:hypothetical protein